MTGIQIRGCEGQVTQGDRHVMTKAETGAMQLQAKELQRMPANHRKEARKDSPKGFRGSLPCGHLHCELLASRTVP